jgi:hypothetical protein
MAITAVTGFTESFSDTHPFYRGTYFRVVGRTATGSGNGSSETAHAGAQQRLGQLTDFSFPYRFGGRFYLGVRAVIIVTATASGSGTASATANILKQRTATGSGSGAGSAVRVLVAVRTATGSGVGSASSVEDVIHFVLRTATGSGTGTSQASGVRVVPRTGTGSGTGSGTADWNINPARTATGSGVGSSVTVRVRVPVRTATGSGVGSGTGVDLVVNIRTATGSGVGSGDAVGARINRRTGTATGAGDGSADWTKSHIFRVPYTETYPGGYFGGGDAANRLQRYNRTNVRGLNLYKLTDGSYTTITQRDLGQVAKIWYGGRDNFLTDAEVVELTEAGFGASIT